LYIDSHAHLEGHKFDSDRAEMLLRRLRCESPSSYGQRAAYATPDEVPS
jgi:hypothetical protein